MTVLIRRAQIPGAERLIFVWMPAGDGDPTVLATIVDGTVIHRADP